MQDEVDKSVYIKMADDLESAAKRLKKRKVKKVKEAPSEIAAWWGQCYKYFFKWYFKYFLF